MAAMSVAMTAVAMPISVRQGLRAIGPSRQSTVGTGLEEQFRAIASYIALLIEAGAVLVVAFGAVQALTGVVAAILRKSADEMQGRQIWIRFATWILLALEFALAADLVRTAVAPTWDDIAKLAVIATIRTMLNYFLAKDIAEFEPVERSGGSPPPA
jgi:uncharacterized membrane protein